MSTQIKKNGNWVTVAGGTRMWVGTKAALQAALDAGEVVDGTAVMVTDDYEEIETGQLSNGDIKLNWSKAGNVVSCEIVNNTSIQAVGEYVFNFPFKPKHTFSGFICWATNVIGYFNIYVSGLVIVTVTTASSVSGGFTLVME